MAISTYTELLSAIASWTHRDDQTALIPDFIKLAEVRIMRTFAPRGTDTETELSSVQSSRYVVLPTGATRPTGLWLKDSLPRTEIPQRLAADLAGSNEEGIPEEWAIDGTNIAFDRPCESVFTFDFRYTAPFALSDASPTNYVLTSYPDLYLFGCLIESYMHALDLTNAAIYEQRYQQALKDSQHIENAARTVPLVTEFAAYGGGNILRGY